MDFKRFALSFLGFVFLICSLLNARDLQTNVVPNLSSLLLEPEAVILSAKESDFYFSLGLDSQVLEGENVSSYWDAFHQLARQNPELKYFSHPRKNREDFVSKINRTRYPLIFATDKGEVGMILGKETNRWKKLDAIGVIQTNRPPGYLKDDFHSADALDIPRWLIYHLIFAKKAPARLEAALKNSGQNPDDYFVIYFMPEAYDWAVGERLPLLPFILPKELLRSRGYEIEDLDFANARVVFPQDAIHHYQQSGDLRDLGSAGIHLPMKTNPSEELFLSYSLLDKVYQSLHSIYLMSVSLANPKNFEELHNQVNDLSEDLVAEKFETIEKLEEYSSLMSVLLQEAILHPTHFPEEDRARNLQMQKSGSLSRAPIRIARRVSESQIVHSLGNLIGSAAKKLGREKNKSLEEDRKELRELTQNFIEEQENLIQQSKTQALRIQESQTWKSRYTEPSAETTTSGKMSWSKRLLLASVCALPFATVAGKLLPVLVSEWDQILPYAGMGSFFASVTATSFVWYAYLRNTSIRDARAKGLLYEDVDERTAKLLEKTDKLEDENSALTEEERLEAAIQERNQAGFSESRLKAAFEKSSYFLANFRDHLKLRSIKAWYGLRSLEERAEYFKKNPQSANLKSSLDLFGNVMARAWGSAFAFPLHRQAVHLMFPFYFDSVQRGGRGNWEDQGLWPSPYYWSLRAATYGMGFLYPGFKPDSYWEQRSAAREVSIQNNSIIEPAVQRAVRQLCIAKALELGMDVKLIPSLLSVQRHIHQEGLTWLEDLQRLLPERARLSREKLIELVAYSDEIVYLSRRPFFLQRMEVQLRHLDQNWSLAQKTEELSAYTKEQIQKEIEYYENLTGEEAHHYRSFRHRILTRWTRWRMNKHETFFRVGKSGENLTRLKSLSNLGRYPYTHLQDRLIITAQVVPIIASRSLHQNMSEAELFNGLAPIFLFLGPDNLQNYGGGLAASSRMIDQLMEDRLPNQDQPYYQAIWENFSQAPWKKIWLQSSAMVNLRLITAANSALLMVGMLYPIDVALTAWHSAFGNEEFISSAISKGAGRLANGFAGATINFTFGVASVPIYRSLMYLRRSAGGIGSNGYEALQQQNPHRFADRLFFGSVQAGLNIGYGIAAGWGVPLISKHVLDAADVSVVENAPLDIPPVAPDSSLSQILHEDRFHVCADQLRAAVSLLRQAE